MNQIQAPLKNSFVVVSSVIISFVHDLLFWMELLNFMVTYCEPSTYLSLLTKNIWNKIDSADEQEELTWCKSTCPDKQEIRNVFNNYSSSPAEWVIDSEARRARGIIVLVKSN